MKKLVILFAGMAMLCLGNSAMAQQPPGVHLSMSLASGASSGLTLGSSVAFNLNISGLHGSANISGSPALGASDLFVNYDSSILSVTGATFGNYLGAGYTYLDLSTPGQVYLSETSYESAASLEANQPAAFTMGTVSFTAIGAGTSTITFDPASSLSSENAQHLDVVSITGAQVGVVPEPSTYALVFLGLIGLFCYKLRCRSIVA